MEIEEVEKAIIERLQNEIIDLKVEGFPEKSDQFRMNHPKGHILVHYQDSDFSEPQTIDMIVQEERMRFLITVSLRQLRTHIGVYGYLEKIKKALSGFKILGCKKIYPETTRFFSEDNGIWTYGMLVIIPTFSVEVSGENNPNLSNFIINGNYGDLDISGFYHGVEGKEAVV